MAKAKTAKQKAVPFTGEHMLSSEYLSHAQRKVFGKARAVSAPGKKAGSKKAGSKKPARKRTAKKVAAQESAASE